MLKKIVKKCRNQVHGRSKWRKIENIFEDEFINKNY
jgi:hypothetical protein